MTDQLDEAIKTIADGLRLAQSIIIFSDENLATTIELMREKGEVESAVRTLANLRNAAELLRKTFAEAHDRVLAASAKTDGEKPN